MPMHRTIWICTFVAGVVLFTTLACAADKPVLKETLALQEAVQDAIAEAEGSVACITVSQSDRYRQLGQGPSANRPGKLGGYQPPPARVQRPFAPPVPDE